MKPNLSSNVFHGVQSFCTALGKWSCYSFCILKLAERITGNKYNVINALLNAINNKYIKYNWDNHDDLDNMFVNDAAAWLSDLTGNKWTCEKVYTMPINEAYFVEVWNNAHFRLFDWDSLSYSNSVATGKITSWRVFRRV